ncbi:hypothetical protein PC41400_14660 [Paenibacillus chitinolyticus]|uniref:DUF4157 domain-containing protein n=1 Tax=Paenibacillus chitinolyticus TaxID=79263 RepID=A0A410WX88_9BACL|nr:hypothetical protein [Paenibacillus chitinolyticus]MCY9593987.1 hypothetical protein [Paenibacillus chitinolyticus]MCY9599642.1 hypothetical protein [Paenibacillus chitinolyticus]QAV18851.1 hypothetical protein PC41400_14660 [Paenibacillus chitinolyticus]
MVDEKTLFYAHTENLKRELNVDPLVFFGEEAKEKTKKYGSLFLGAHVWEENPEFVAVADTNNIGILAHEMRHSWQYKNRNKENYTFRSSSNKPWILKKLARALYLIYYSFNRKEMDANNYAIEYCRKTGLHHEVLRIEKLIKENRLAQVITILAHPLFVYLLYVVWAYLIV